MLHLMAISCSAFSGFKEAFLGVTMLPATLNTHSLFELAAGQGHQKQPWLSRRAVGTAAVLVVLPSEQLVAAAVSIRQELVAATFPLKLALRYRENFTVFLTTAVMFYNDVVA